MYQAAHLTVPSIESMKHMVQCTDNASLTLVLACHPFYFDRGQTWSYIRFTLLRSEKKCAAIKTTAPATTTTTLYLQATRRADNQDVFPPKRPIK